MQNHNHIRIRVADPQDAAELLEIYAPYVLQTAITFEYHVPTPDEFRQRIEMTLIKYPYLIAECDSRILGYAYASPFKERAAYDWAVEMSVYVQQAHRGMGIGRKLYEAMEQTLREQNILNLNACIAWPEPEDEYLTRDSVDFHTHLGYRMVGQFHQCGYKFHRWYDMIWMEKHIGSHTGAPKDVIPFSKLNQ